MLVQFNIYSAVIKSHIVLLLVLLLAGAGMAQTAVMTVDHQYERARQVAFEEGNYHKAREYAYEALEERPNYHEIRVFIARLYAWERQYGKARKELQYVLERAPDNRAALTAVIDVESWSESYDSGLRWARTALISYPQDEEFLLAKANFTQKMENSDQAEKIYLNILDLHPGSVEARDGLESLTLQQMKYRAKLSYRRDRFSQIFEPWDIWEVQLSRQTDYGSVIGRIQYANRFSTNGVQFNVDAYPSLVEGLYGYINAGYSQASIYPDFRFGISLYKSLPAAFELEGGARYLNFSSSETFIYTFSLSKYWGNYLFTGRTYVVPSSVGASQSFSLLSRRYFGNGQKYVGVTSGFGSASSNIQFFQDIQRLDSWSVSIESQFPLSQRLNIGGNVGFDSEEFLNYKRERFSFKLYLSYRF